MKPPVTIIVPTVRRPTGLETALQSLFAQVEVDAVIREIVVVDNDPAGSAWQMIDSLRRISPWPLIYVHEPRPGVANARNSALSATDAPVIAFLDDDETARPEWLSRLYAAHLELGSDVTFGPIKGIAIGATGDSQSWLNAFFSRSGPSKTQLIDQAYGCGASIMTRATTLTQSPPFDPDANATGGEDDRLFARLKQGGARFGWAADAWVYEHAPTSRSTPAYALSRAIAYGQSPCQKNFRARPVRWLSILGWMAVGMGQTIIYGGGFIALKLARRPAAWPMADRAARGLGKLLWMMRLEFYGTATRG